METVRETEYLWCPTCGATRAFGAGEVRGNVERRPGQECEHVLDTEVWVRTGLSESTRFDV